MRRISLFAAGIAMLLLMGPAQTADVTFFSYSDIHYGADGGGRKPPIVKSEMVPVINGLPGTTYPTGIGGKVDTPLGIIMPGDLINDGALKAKYPSSDVQCRVGNAESLPIQNASLDHVFANMYLHHVADPQTAIAEMVRTLKPGGKLTITDLDTHEHEFLKTEQHDVWMGFERTDVERWFVDAGLEGVVVDCVGQNCCTESEQGEDAAISIFVASGRTPV